MRNSVEDLPKLKKQVENLREVFHQNYEKRFEYPNDNHFSFMLLCFLNKQFEHLNSVLNLVNSELYSDAMIISRNMIEGFAIINWVSKDKNKRALRWRKYCVVTDYRIALKRNKGDKNKIDKDIIDRLEKEGEEYLFERLRKPKVQKNNLSADPYKQYWLFDDDGKEVKIYSLFDEGDKQLYEIYSDMSDWVHWNVNRIGRRLTRDKSEVGYFKNPAQDGCLALSSAFLSLFYLMDVVNQYLKLNYDSVLNNVTESYKVAMNDGDT